LRLQFATVSSEAAELAAATAALDAEAQVHFDHMGREREKDAVLRARHREEELAQVSATDGAARQVAVLAAQLGEIEDAAAVQRYVSLQEFTHMSPFTM